LRDPEGYARSNQPGHLQIHGPRYAARVLAFDANECKDSVVACAKDANAKINVDRLGDADNLKTWQKAIDLGTAGIRTNLSAELTANLRAHNMATH
jgi:glycerophosphoryl diester phosphodiesterase